MAKLIAVFLCAMLGSTASANSPLILPGEGEPILLGGTPEALWVLRQAEGQMPQWWLVRGNQINRVELPAASRYAAPLPSGQGILVLVGDQARLFDLNPAGKVIEKQQWPVPVGAAAVHPRLDGRFEPIGDRAFWPLFEAGNLHVLAWSKSGSLEVFAVSHERQAPLSANRAEGAFFQPKTTAGVDHLVWMEAEQCFQWQLTQPKAVISQKVPRLRNMEQAVPIPTKAGLNWLIHGGERGDLGSFGWRLADSGGKELARGRGIVTRFGFLRDQGPQRLLIWTVSQKIRSQLWAAMSGSRNFMGQVLQEEQGRWQLLQKIEVKLSKGDGESAFGVIWQADIDQDGRGDLVAADEKHGLRVYRTQADGRFADDERKLQLQPEELLVLDQTLYAVEKKGLRWQLTPVRLK